MTDALKYPVGDFTQSEMAELNGVEKMKIYLPLKEALAKGIVIKTGTRPTGARPSNVYRVSAEASGQMSPLARICPADASKVPTSLPIQPIVVVPSSVIESPAEAIIQPEVVTAPSASEPGQICPKGTEALLKPLTLYPCPLCNKPMIVIKDSSGVWVRCQGNCDPSVHETVFGHGKNAAVAYAIAGEKYKKTPQP